MQAMEMITETKTPKPVDIHVGARVRALRHIRGMSQTTLANAMGITFQQVQKYEKGTNRISASMLYEVAKCLEVPVDYFFDGLPKGGEEIDVTIQENGRLCDALMAQKDGPLLAKTFLSMDSNARRAFMEFVTATVKTE